MTSPAALPLGLSMLWESVDPADALRDRFGFAGSEAVVGWASRLVADRWGIAVVGCPRMVISDRNAILWAESERGPLVVKWSCDTGQFARLAATTSLLGVLGEHDVPVAHPVRTLDGADRVVVNGPIGPLSVAVLPELTGSWLDVGDPVAVRAAGATLARVHEAFRDVVVPSALGGDRVPPLSTLVPDADHASVDDRVQLLHNDFRAANVLVDDGAVVGVLDLDDVIVGPPVFDLAKASTYLGTRFTDWGPTSRAAQEGFRRGYEDVRALSAAEAAWLPDLVAWLEHRAGW